MINRIKAILLQEYFITKHSLEVIIDLFYFSIVNIIVFGLFSNFLSGSTSSLSARYLLLGMILWEIIRITQYSVSVGALWNIWSRNLSNMFIAPLSIAEYLIAGMIAGIFKTLLALIVISLISFYLFNFNLLQVGIINLLFSFINLTIFAWSIGIVILGIIFRYGTRLQALAWGLVFIFQPLTATFFPVSILPDFLQKIAYLFPPTYVFESVRFSLTNSTIDCSSAMIAFFQNIVYFIISILFFNNMFNKSKETGQFAKNEG